MILMFVIPHKGLSDLRFGMTREAVEKVMGTPPTRFKSGDFALEEDFFREVGINVSYDEHGLCNAIGVGRDFGVDVDYEGYRLLSHPAAEVREWARRLDPDLDTQYGFTSKKLGLNMWADWIDSPVDEVVARDVASSFLVFRPGYYEEEHARMVRAGLIPP